MNCSYSIRLTHKSKRVDSPLLSKRKRCSVDQHGLRTTAIHLDETDPSVCLRLVGARSQKENRKVSLLSFVDKGDRSKGEIERRDEGVKI